MVIETKEQYEQAQFVGDREFAHKVMDGQGLAGTVEAIFDLRETIEALREVARAADKLVHHTKGYEEADAAETVLAFKVEALPDWLIEE